MAKKKINDDTLLQLIRDGNSPAEGIRKSLEVVELEQRISALEERAKPRSSCRNNAKGIFHYSRFTIHDSPFTMHAPVITYYGRESNPKPSIKSVCCAISPCI